MKSLYRRFPFLDLGRIPPVQRLAYQIQILLLFVISTFLYLGFPGTREWRRIAEEDRMHTIIRGWDGLAWYVWLAAAPFMLLLIQKYPLIRGRILSQLGKIMLGSVGLYLAVAHVRYFCRILPDILLAPRSAVQLDLDSYAYNTFAMLPLDFLTYCGFIAVSFSIDYYFKLRQRNDEAAQLRLQAVQLQSDLARAELAALRGQLHPHFLFNSFNALATLVRQRKNDEAVEIIAQLSALLRLAIDQTGLPETPLGQELDFIRRYLAIEHVRFAEKLRVEYVIDPATIEVLVPNIILQPLVENAIKHGISRRTTPGCVRLQAERLAGRLHITIADDGAEDTPVPAASTDGRRYGIGLANTRARLTNLYGADYRLEIGPRPQGGTIVTLDLPWRLAPAKSMPT